MAAVHKLVFPDDLESQEGAFMHFRISQSYKFKREKIDDKEVYATVTLPLPAWTFSLKVNTMLESRAIPVVLAAGVLDSRVGASVSAVVKLSVSELIIPA